MWVGPWIGRRKIFGIHNHLLEELQSEDAKYYDNYLRMDANTFRFVVCEVCKFISKDDAHMRNCISVEDWLKTTLIF